MNYAGRWGVSVVMFLDDTLGSTEETVAYDTNHVMLSLVRSSLSSTSDSYPSRGRRWRKRLCGRGRRRASHLLKIRWFYNPEGAQRPERSQGNLIQVDEQDKLTQH